MRQITRSAKQRWRQDERRACYRSPNRQLVGARASATNSSRVFLIMQGCDLVLGSADHRRNRLQEGCLHS